MTINTGANVSKATSYTSLSPPEGANVSKATSYTVLSPPDGIAISKAVVYVLLAPAETEGSVSFSPLSAEGGDTNLTLLSLSASGIAGPLVTQGDLTLQPLSASGGTNDLRLSTLTSEGVWYGGIAPPEGAVLNADLVLQPLVPYPLIGSDCTADDLEFLPLQGLGGIDHLELSPLAAGGEILVGNSLAAALRVQGINGSGDWLAGNDFGTNISLRRLQLDAEASGTTLPAAPATALLTIPLLAASGTLIGEAIGTAEIELPLLVADGAFVEQEAGFVVGELSLEPLVMGDTEPQIAGFRTIAINTRNRAATEYSGFAFNSYAKFRGVTLAAGPGGLYALVGSTDDGAPIDMLLQGGLLDYGGDKLKRAHGAYVSYIAEGQANVTVTNEDDESYTYVVAQAPSLRQHLVKFGMGMKGRWRQIAFRNVAGGMAKVQAIAPDIEVLSRRI